MIVLIIQFFRHIKQTLMWRLLYYKIFLLFFREHCKEWSKDFHNWMYRWLQHKTLKTKQTTHKHGPRLLIRVSLKFMFYLYLCYIYFYILSRWSLENNRHSIKYRGFSSKFEGCWSLLHWFLLLFVLQSIDYKHDGKTRTPDWRTGLYSFRTCIKIPTIGWKPEKGRSLWSNIPVKNWKDLCKRYQVLMYKRLILR